MNKRTKLLSLVLICALAVAMILPGTPAEVKASSTSFSVSSIEDNDFHGCKIQYSTDGTNWTDITSTMSATVANYLRIVLADGYEVAGHTAVRVSGTDVLHDNMAAFTNENGYALTDGNEYQIENIQFQAVGGGGNDPSVPQENVTGIVVRAGTQTKTLTPEDLTFSVNSDDITDLEFCVEAVIVNGDTAHPILLTNVGNKSNATDSKGRNPLEIQTTVATKNQLVVNLQYHAEDDPVAENRAYGFYFIGVTFTSNAIEGIKITSSTHPDMYDDTVYTELVDVSGTTASTPAKAAVYYDSTDFSITEVGGTAVSSVALTGGIPAGAVTITENNVKFNSGYYATIPLTVRLADGKVGYVSVDRLGIEVCGTNANVNPFVYHGSQKGSDMRTVAGAKTYNVVAVFYYDTTHTYADYDLVANLTYENGSTETKVVTGFSEKDCTTDAGKTKGGEYLLWTGDSQGAMPVSVSVTAVKHGATNASSFSGALFGAGKGATETKQGFDYKR